MAARRCHRVERFVDVFIDVYTLAILAYILTSWVQLPYSLRPVQRFLYDVCEPYLRLWRRLLPLRSGRSTSRRWSRSSPDRCRADPDRGSRAA